MKAHESSVVHPDAQIAEDVVIGPGCVIGKDVTIGKGSVLGPHVIVEGITSIGENCRVFAGAILGTAPQDLKYRGEPTKLVIGNDNTIREYATINRGTVSKGQTTIGNGNLIMAYAHIAHDCTIGNSTVLANVATLAGHVELEDKVIIGGITPIHQFVRIGRLSIVGGASRVVKDVPPYCKAAGSPMKMAGLNTIGLERNDVPEDVKKQLKMAYKMMFRSKVTTKQALENIEKQGGLSEEVMHFVEFIRKSERGVCRE
ncbi:MAG: acyl-ACP--UDP-N-acetylglucosamine O-acyltransferase [bacterium]